MSVCSHFPVAFGELNHFTFETLLLLHTYTYTHTVHIHNIFSTSAQSRESVCVCFSSHSMHYACISICYCICMNEVCVRACVGMPDTYVFNGIIIIIIIMVYICVCHPLTSMWVPCRMLSFFLRIILITLLS